jgi:AsmA protein
MKAKAHSHTHRLLKIFIPIIAIIVIGLVAGYFLLTSFLTGPRIQNLAQKMATETLQRPVEIGRVGLRIRFGIGITIDDLSIPNIEGFKPGPMLQIKRTILNLQLLPLLTRRVVIRRIELQKLQANVEQNAKKELNFAGLMPKQTKGTGWVVSLSKITIRDSEVRYRDALTNTEYTVEDIDQNIDFRHSIISVSGRLTAQTPQMEKIPQLELRISNKFHYDTLGKYLDVKDISISTKPVQLRIFGSVKDGSNLDLKGSLDIKELSRLTSIIPSSAQPGAMDGAIKGNFKVSGTTEKPVIAGKFELSDIKIVPKGMERGVENVSGNISFDHESIEDISIQGNIGATHFSITGAISGILTKKPALEIGADIKGDLKDFQGMTKDMKSIIMNGALVSSVKVRGTADKPNFAGDIRIANATIDGIGLGKPLSNFNFSGRLTEDDLRLTGCKGEIGHSDFSLTGEIMNFKKPVIRIDNRSRYIDLDELMPKKEKSTAKGSQPALINLSGTLVIDRLTGMDMEFKSINTSFKYENGIIDIRNCRAQSFDGDVYLDFYYNTNSPEPYQLSSRLQSVSAQKILQRFLKLDRVQGKLTGTGDFKGKGLDQKSVVSNLDGKGNLKFSNGTFSNFPLLVKLLGWLGMKDYKNVQFNNMQGGFTISNGQARIEDWTLSSQAGDFLTNGSIGLDGKLNLQVAATLSKSNSAMVKKYHGDWLLYADKNGQAVVDVIVTGKHDAPAFRLDNNKIKQRLSGKVKDEFEQKKKEFEKQVKDWLKWK